MSLQYKNWLVWVVETSDSRNVGQAIRVVDLTDPKLAPSTIYTGYNNALFISFCITNSLNHDLDENQTNQST